MISQVVSMVTDDPLRETSLASMKSFRDASVQTDSKFLVGLSNEVHDSVENCPKSSEKQIGNFCGSSKQIDTASVKLRKPPRRKVKHRKACSESTTPSIDEPFLSEFANLLNRNDSSEESDRAFLELCSSELS